MKKLKTLMKRSKSVQDRSFFRPFQYDDGLGMWVAKNGNKAVHEENFLSAGTKKNDVETGEDAKKG